MLTRLGPDRNALLLSQIFSLEIVYTIDAEYVLRHAGDYRLLCSTASEWCRVGHRLKVLVPTTDQLLGCRRGGTP